MPYVKGYKGQKIWVKSKTCEWCDNYDPEFGICMQTSEAVSEDRSCEYFAPRGQGGGE
jgi:hypothetical protein